MVVNTSSPAPVTWLLEIEMLKRMKLEGLVVGTSIGIHDFERQAAQPYRVDIALRLDDDYQPQNDDIRETVDYDTLRSRVKDYLSAKHINLQETVIHDLIAICFNLDARVLGVDIQVAKTAVYRDSEAVGLHYELTRQEWMASNGELAGN